MTPSSPPRAQFVWKACIFGPADTPWEGGVFQLRLQFSKDYPQTAPSVQFLSRMFHPNIYKDGALCLDIIQDKWKPIYTVSTILTSIQSLLQDPNPVRAALSWHLRAHSPLPPRPFSRFPTLSLPSPPFASPPRRTPPRTRRPPSCGARTARPTTEWSDYAWRTAERRPPLLLSIPLPSLSLPSRPSSMPVPTRIPTQATSSPLPADTPSFRLEWGPPPSPRPGSIPRPRNTSVHLLPDLLGFRRAGGERSEGPVGEMYCWAEGEETSKSGARRMELQR